MTKQKLFQFGKIAFEIALCALCVAVIAQNRILLSRLRAQENISGTRVGQKVGDLVGTALNGAMEQIVLPESRQKLLIITFSPACQYCKANQKGWAALARALKQDAKWRVVWVSRDPLDPTREYCAASEIPSSDAVADPPYRTYAQLGLRVVPRMIAVLPGGKVDRVWEGQLSTEVWKEVYSYFGVRWSL